MEKKNIVGDLPSTNRGRKKLAQELRKEAFNEAYPNEPIAKVQEDESEDILKPNQEETYKKESPKKGRGEDEEPKAVAATVTQVSSTATREKQKKVKKKKNGASTEQTSTTNEFTSFNCLK